MVNRLLKRVMLAAAVAALTVALVAVPAGSAPAAGSGQETGYLVVLKEHGRAAGLQAIERAGGKLVKLNKLGIATATSSNPAFSSALGSSGAVEAVGNDGGWQLQPLSVTQEPPPVPGPEMAADCAAQYGVAVDVGPDQLSACQWDMRAINASPAASYAVNRGAGATIGIIDTGVDYTHPDIAPTSTWACPARSSPQATPPPCPRRSTPPVPPARPRPPPRTCLATAPTSPASPRRPATVSGSPGSRRRQPWSASRSAPQEASASLRRWWTPSSTPATRASTWPT
jgi:hypothetical protein